VASRSFSHLSFASFPYHFNTAAYLRFCLVISSLVVATINCFFCSVSCASRLCAAMVVYCSQQTNLKYVLLSYVLFSSGPFYHLIFASISLLSFVFSPQLKITTLSSLTSPTVNDGITKRNCLKNCTPLLHFYSLT
jgi:hypothetical protein